MEPERQSRYPVLSQVQRQAIHVQRAEERLNTEWDPMRKLVTSVSIPVLALPLACAVGYFLSDHASQPVTLLAFVATLTLVPAAANLAVRVVQAMMKRSAKTDPVWLEVLEKCRGLNALPEGVAAPLDRALDAYVTMRRVGGDAAWQRAGLPAADFVKHAGTRMLELLEWGRRLKLVGTRMEQLPRDAGTHPEHRETMTHYRLQCQNLSRAAEIFSQAEAKMTRAYAALSGDQPQGSASAEQFEEITATFDALAELAAPPSEAEHWSPTPTAEQVVRLHRGGNQGG